MYQVLLSFIFEVQAQMASAGPDVCHHILCIRRSWVERSQEVSAAEDERPIYSVLAHVVQVALEQDRRIRRGWTPDNLKSMKKCRKIEKNIHYPTTQRSLL